MRIFRLLQVSCFIFCIPFSHFGPPNREHRSDIPPRIGLAFDKKEKLKGSYKHCREHFMSGIGLTPKTQGQKLAGINTISLPTLQKEYPPSGYDIYETDDVRQMWEAYWKVTPYPDCRGGRTWKPFHKLDPNSLQYIVRANKSIIIYDKKTKQIVCLVIWNFSGNKVEVLEWVNEVIVENVDLCKSVRISSFPSSILTCYLNIICYSWRILGKCARSATLLVCRATPSLDGQGICSANKQMWLLAG